MFVFNILVGAGLTSSGSGSGTSGSGLVFGIPLNQCIENDRLARVARSNSPLRSSRSELYSSGDVISSSESTVSKLTTRRQSHHGSRTSFSSLIDTGASRADDVSNV